MSVNRMQLSQQLDKLKSIGVEQIKWDLQDGQKNDANDDSSNDILDSVSQLISQHAEQFNDSLQLIQQFRKQQQSLKELEQTVVNVFDCQNTIIESTMNLVQNNTQIQENKKKLIELIEKGQIDSKLEMDELDYKTSNGQQTDEQKMQKILNKIEQLNAQKQLQECLNLLSSKCTLSRSLDKSITSCLDSYLWNVYHILLSKLPSIHSPEKCLPVLYENNRTLHEQYYQKYIQGQKQRWMYMNGQSDTQQQVYQQAKYKIEQEIVVLEQWFDMYSEQNKQYIQQMVDTIIKQLDQVRMDTLYQIYTYYQNYKLHFKTGGHNDGVDILSECMINKYPCLKNFPIRLANSLKSFVSKFMVQFKQQIYRHQFDCLQSYQVLLDYIYVIDPILQTESDDQDIFGAKQLIEPIVKLVEIKMRNSHQSIQSVIFANNVYQLLVSHLSIYQQSNQSIHQQLANDGLDYQQIVQHFQKNKDILHSKLLNEILIPQLDFQQFKQNKLRNSRLFLQVSKQIKTFKVNIGLFSPLKQEVIDKLMQDIKTNYLEAMQKDFNGLLSEQDLHSIEKEGLYVESVIKQVEALDLIAGQKQRTIQYKSIDQIIDQIRERVS